MPRAVVKPSGLHRPRAVQGAPRVKHPGLGCGWARGKADVLYVADAFQVIAKVNVLLAA